MWRAPTETLSPSPFESKPRWLTDNVGPAVFDMGYARLYSTGKKLQKSDKSPVDKVFHFVHRVFHNRLCQLWTKGICKFGLHKVCQEVFFGHFLRKYLGRTERGKPWGAEDGPFWRMKQKRSISRKKLCSFSQRNSRKMPVSRLPTAPRCAIIETVEKPRRGQKSETGGDAYVLWAAAGKSDSGSL